jgi:hypothetical protein
MERFDVGRVPEDEHARLIHLSNAFGRLLFESHGLRHGSERSRSPSHTGPKWKRFSTPSCMQSYRY